MPADSMADIATAGTLIAQSGLCGASNPAEGFVVALTCQQRGIDVLTFSETYHVMMGRVTKRSDAMLADFLRGGGSHQILERSPDAASITLTTADDMDYTFTLTWADACAEPFVYAGNPSQAAAELRKPIAERRFKDKYSTPRSRKQMLWARVVSDAVRCTDPRANQGSYTPEEMGDVVDVTRPPPIDITPPAPMPSPIAADPQYDICPIADDGCEYTGRAWRDVPPDHLSIALDLDHPAMLDGHRDAIRAILENL